jgi:N-acylmannosamine kinase/N-acetylmannosamine-6-phosphate 2-epimerase/N-acetylmannosamine kinase
MAHPDSVLALDIGGTKILAALVRGNSVLDRHKTPTPRDSNPRLWLEALFAAIAPWQGRYATVGAAVTGIIDDGHWSALNRNTLDIPDRFPLKKTIAQLAGLPVFVANDAQAAAWGEHRFGAGQNEDMVFLTISTGIGGGIIINGKPMFGLAGHFGQFRVRDDVEGTLEDQVSGLWIANQAASYQPGATAREVFEAAAAGNGWADNIIHASARQTAQLCRNIHLAFDPKRIVIGGSIGLAPPYLAIVRQSLAGLPPRFIPKIHAAVLGESAGVVGIADLAKNNIEEN